MDHPNPYILHISLIITILYFIKYVSLLIFYHWFELLSMAIRQPVTHSFFYQYLLAWRDTQNDYGQAKKQTGNDPLLVRSWREVSETMITWPQLIAMALQWSHICEYSWFEDAWSFNPVEVNGFWFFYAFFKLLQLRYFGSKIVALYQIVSANWRLQTDK